MEKEIIDSIACAQRIVNHVDQSSALTDWLDVIYKIAMIFIASANVSFAFYIFRSKNKKDDYIHEKNRKIGLLKSLILDYNMKYLYDFFDNIDNETQALKTKDLSNEDKKIINDKIIDYGKSLRQKFIDTLLAIDKKLYTELLSFSDELIDNLTETIFNEGINLSHQPMYDEKINKLVTETKTSIIETLFGYKGD